jgi:hypothetical protein
MKKIFGTAFLALIVLSSCEKDKDDCEKTVATISGTYKITSATYTAPGVPGSVDYYAQLDACEKDDLQILNANGNYTYQDAGTACSPSGSYSGTWSLSGNSITIDGETGTIESFNCDELVLSIEIGFVAGDRLVTTLEKQ